MMERRLGSANMLSELAAGLARRVRTHLPVPSLRAGAPHLGHRFEARASTLPLTCLVVLIGGLAVTGAARAQTDGGLGDGPSSDTLPPCCGDGTCDVDEDTCTCPDDCGSNCGDGCCNGGESKCDCPADCAEDQCGDGCCTGSEATCTCPDDCGSLCGDGCCSGGESKCDCPADCTEDQCGDGCCMGTEDTCTCSADCGSSCGDGCCNGGEDWCGCAADCEPVPVCGDGCCIDDEIIQLCELGCCGCPEDCPAVCGDGCCTGDESPPTCEVDCPGPTCGDGWCDEGEDGCSCPEDCGQNCCGDGLCVLGEDDCNCPEDCVAVCNDGCCTESETCANCAMDCGFCVPDCGAGACNDGWTRRFGVGAPAIVVHASDINGDVYVTGFTSRSFEANDGRLAGVFLSKYDSSGDVLWTNEFGTASGEGRGVAADLESVYVAGWVGPDSTLIGQTALGMDDAFLRAYDSEGNELWTRQFGTIDDDYAYAVEFDDTGVYVVGATYDAVTRDVIQSFLRKHDSVGNELWALEFGGSTPPSEALTLSTAASGVYVAGPHGQGSFLHKYGTDGVEAWVDEFGHSTNMWMVAWAVSAMDAGLVWVTGPEYYTQFSGFVGSFLVKYSHGGSYGGGVFFGDESTIVTSIDTMPAGVYMGGKHCPPRWGCTEDDVFVTKTNPSHPSSQGLWETSFGTPGNDEFGGLTVDTTGIYAAGTLQDQRYGFVRRMGSVGGEVWTRLFSGCTTGDSAGGIDVGGDLYVVGGTGPGPLPGQTTFGANDAFARRHDFSGNEVWTRQFGTSGDDDARATSATATAVYAVGQMAGSAFVRQLDLQGTEVWTDQFEGSNEVRGVASDASAAYVVGRTDGALPGQTSAGLRDAFIRKYLAAGSQAWTSQFGTAEDDVATSVAVHASGVYATGNLGAILAFVRKYDVDGNEIWTREFEPATSRAIAADDRGVFVTGTSGSDVFVHRYDSDGNLLWTHDLGTSADDHGDGVAVNFTGVYVGGHTDGVFPGESSAGGTDSFVRCLDFGGNEIWTRQYGTEGADQLADLGVNLSDIYAFGKTEGVYASCGHGDLVVNKLVVDRDGDGIVDQTTVVDTEPAIFSDDFSDTGLAGSTSGTITDRGEQTLFIRDEGSPDGVMIATSPTGGASQAAGNACGGLLDFSMGPGEEMVVTCSSVHVKVRRGLVDLVFYATDGREATATIGEGYGVDFEPTTFILAALPSNPTPVLVEMDGVVYSFAPGATEGNQPPVAVAGPDQTAILGEAVHLYDAGSFDPDGTLFSWEWHFGDDETASGPDVTHVYAEAGQYVAELWVTDDLGVAGLPDQVLVTVMPVSESIDVLAALVRSYNLKQGITDSLDAKLLNVKDALNAENAGQREDAVHKLAAFLNAVDAQRGKALTTEQADRLTSDALRILAVL